MSVLSDNLKYLRNQRNLSQQKIADILAITQRKYSYYETGQREPNLETLTKLSDFFGKSLDVLVRIRLLLIANDI